MNGKRYIEQFKVEAVKQVIQRGRPAQSRRWKRGVEYIEMFYNPKRRRSSSERLSPIDYERQYFDRLGRAQEFR